MDAAVRESRYADVIDDICELNWRGLNANDLADAARAYYFFSIQFRENLQIARELYPADEKLKQLEREECNTANLSPWPGVALPNEKMNHDEFMRRLLKLSAGDAVRAARVEAIGQSYLNKVRGMDRTAKALSIASYEDGGLEKVFGAFLKAKNWDGPLLQAFRHFVTKHIEFDSDPDQGHGALSRHLGVDDRVLPLWEALKELLVRATPKLAP